MHLGNNQEGARSNVYAIVIRMTDLQSSRKLTTLPAGFRENTENRVDLPTIKYVCAVHPTPLRDHEKHDAFQKVVSTVEKGN